MQQPSRDEPSEFDTRQDSNPSSDGDAEDHALEFDSLNSFVERLQSAAGTLHEDGRLLSFGRYEIVDQIARGGQSTTYLARDPDLDRKVVIKLYDKRLGNTERLAVTREGRLLAKIESPYVVHCHTIGYCSDASEETGLEGAEKDSTPFLVLERIDGISLDRLMRIKKFTPDEIRHLVRQLALGLAAAHSIGLIHRDIKPANIMVTRDGIPKLIDFGLALPAGETSGGAGTGTAAYMSPEQARGGLELDQTTDIFGLGAVLYELLTCYAPFRGESRDAMLAAAQRGTITPLKELNPSVDRDLARLCSECLRVERSGRPPSAALIANRLSNARRSRLPWLALAACVAALLGWSWSVIQRYQQLTADQQTEETLDTSGLPPSVEPIDGTASDNVAPSTNVAAQQRSRAPHEMPVFGMRPNILLCIADDLSYRYTGANGDRVVSTPGFDRVAAEGLRFEHAFADAPVGGPSRNALLTGQPIWRLEQGGNSYSTLAKKFPTYTERLFENGYQIGATGRRWVGDLFASERTLNPAGRSVHKSVLDPPADGISETDYAANFALFLDKLPADTPFCFWLGTHEPHRRFESGSGEASGINPDLIEPPASLPDAPNVRGDLADYLFEIQYFDRVVSQAVELLESRGMLDNTLIVVTSDNGMPFPRGKATLYDAGTRVPLAIRWPQGIVNAGRVVPELTSLSDLAPTFLDVAGIERPSGMTARGLTDLIVDEAVLERDATFCAMERHEYCRAGGRGYPCRAIRTERFLYIYNFEPSLWPSGSPDCIDATRGNPFSDIPRSITKTFLLNHRAHPIHGANADLAFAKRPAEELYDVVSDPDQLVNLAGLVQMAETQAELRRRLFEHLERTQDPRVVGGTVAWDEYEFFGPIE